LDDFYFGNDLKYRTKFRIQDYQSFHGKVLMAFAQSENIRKIEYDQCANHALER
jgi:hypothetical protein